MEDKQVDDKQTIDEQRIIEIAVKAALSFMKKEKQSEEQSRNDKRLRNTRLLLENYNALNDHCRNAIYDRKTANASDNPIDLLDAINDYNRNTFIQTIKDSVLRTRIIITHINEMLKLYKIYCETSVKPEDVRRYRILQARYFDGKGIEAICEIEKIDQSTYYRDSRDIINKLSALIFGIDGLSDMRKSCQ